MRRLDNGPIFAAYGMTDQPWGNYRADGLNHGNWTIVATPYSLPDLAGDEGPTEELHLEMFFATGPGSPTWSPTHTPSLQPSQEPTSKAPTKAPTSKAPSAQPSKTPTSKAPTKAPTFEPTPTPTSGAPSAKPSSAEAISEAQADYSGVAVSGFYLVDAKNNEDMVDLGVIADDGFSIDRSALPRKLTARAVVFIDGGCHPYGVTLDHVRMEFQGELTSKEFYQPYALFSDWPPGNYRPTSHLDKPGTYQIKATPILTDGSQGKAFELNMTLT